MSGRSAALVGFGRVAELAHAPALRARADVRVAAVAEARPERLKEASRLFPSARLYASLDALLRETRPDFVDIATPPALHFKQARASLEAGCSVLCEKPLVLASKELASLKALALEKRLALAPVHNWKHAPLLLKLHALLRSGALGRLRHAQLHVLREKPAATAPSGEGNWRTVKALAGGGILVDHGWHNFYLLNWLLDQAPLGGRGRLSLGAHGVEEEASCLIAYPQASAALHLSWRSPWRAHWGVFYGEEGTAEIQDDRLVLRKKGIPPQTFCFPEALSASSAHPDWFAGSLAEFLDALDDPSKRPALLEEAERCVFLLEQLRRDCAA